MVSGEKYIYVPNFAHLYTIYLILWLLVRFSLYLLSNLVMIFLVWFSSCICFLQGFLFICFVGFFALGLFVLFSVGIHWDPWICEFIVLLLFLIKLLVFSAMISPDTFPSFISFLPFRDADDTCGWLLLLPHWSLLLFNFFSHFFLYLTLDNFYCSPKKAHWSFFLFWKNFYRIYCYCC